MKVRAIMTAKVATASPKTTIDEIATMMRDEDTGAIPVVDDGELVGVITDRDIVIRCIADGEDAAKMTADEVLSARLETIEPDAEVEEAARLMARSQVRRLPVVENGQLVGMVSLGDIAVKASDSRAGEALEEVSHGVKASQAKGRQVQTRKPTVEQAGRRMGVSAEQRLDQERGESRMVSGGRSARQGIANRDIGEEVQRQSKVVPIRNQGKTTRKRRAG
jgi:CBS domain-containing protein